MATVPVTKYHLPIDIWKRFMFNHTKLYLTSFNLKAESLREDGFECLVAIRDRDEVLTEGMDNVVILITQYHQFLQHPI